MICGLFCSGLSLFCVITGNRYIVFVGFLNRKTKCTVLRFFFFLSDLYNVFAVCVCAGSLL